MYCRRIGSRRIGGRRKGSRRIGSRRNGNTPPMERLPEMCHFLDNEMCPVHIMCHVVMKHCLKGGISRTLTLILYTKYPETQEMCWTPDVSWKGNLIHMTGNLRFDMSCYYPGNINTRKFHFWSSESCL